jgi:hypothetical protein
LVFLKRHFHCLLVTCSLVPKSVFSLCGWILHMLDLQLPKAGEV